MDAVERAKVRLRVLGGVMVVSLLAAVVMLAVGSPLVGRVEGESAFAGNTLAQTVQDSTVVCTVPEMHAGKSDFQLFYTPHFTESGANPASLTVSLGKGGFGTTGLAWIVSATFRNQQKGVFADQKRCRHASTFVPLSHTGLSGPPDRLHSFTCIARGQLLIRARAVWDRRGFAAASIAVRSYATRKLVAFGFLNHSGYGGLYTSRGCVPNS